ALRDGTIEQAALVGLRGEAATQLRSGQAGIGGPGVVGEAFTLPRTGGGHPLSDDRAGLRVDAATAVDVHGTDGDAHVDAVQHGSGQASQVAAPLQRRAAALVAAAEGLPAGA